MKSGAYEWIISLYETRSFLLPTPAMAIYYYPVDVKEHVGSIFSV